MEAAPIAVKRSEPPKDQKDDEQLEFYGELARQEAILLFCDLSASSSLYSVFDEKTAIGCMREYLQRQTDLVYRFGGTVDTYLGDGAMFRFNVLRIRQDPVTQAAETALKMQMDFEALKGSWIARGWKVAPIHSRIGIACGHVYEVAMDYGPFRALALMGLPIVRASRSCSCEAVPRDRNIIWLDEETQGRLDKNFVVRPVADPAKKLGFTAYELIGRK